MKRELNPNKKVLGRTRRLASGIVDFGVREQVVKPRGNRGDRLVAEEVSYVMVNPCHDTRIMRKQTFS